MKVTELIKILADANRDSEIKIKDFDNKKYDIAHIEYDSCIINGYNIPGIYIMINIEENK